MSSDRMGTGSARYWLTAAAIMTAYIGHAWAGNWSASLAWATTMLFLSICEMQSDTIDLAIAMARSNNRKLREIRQTIDALRRAPYEDTQ